MVKYIPVPHLSPVSITMIDLGLAAFVVVCRLGLVEKKRRLMSWSVV